jgi:hypothetical protein
MEQVNVALKWVYYARVPYWSQWVAINLHIKYASRVVHCAITNKDCSKCICGVRCIVLYAVYCVLCAVCCVLLCALCALCSVRCAVCSVLCAVCCVLCAV